MDAYRIGVSIALSNGVSPVLAVITRDLLGVQAPINQITKAFEKWKPALLGAVAVIAGAEMIRGLANIAQHGEKILDQQDKLMRAGLAQNDVLKLQSSYYEKIAKVVPTSTASEFLKTTNELRAVTGSTEEAAALAPKAMMVDTLLSNTLGREVHGEYYKLLRSAEMKGISTDPAKLEKFTDQVFSMITAFGGKLSAEDFQTLARRGGTSFMNARPESIGPIGVLAADLGGSAAGTTLMTLQQLQTGANTLSKQQAQVLADLGLLDMSKATATGFGGSRLQLQPGAIKGSLEHIGDLPGWIKDTVYPALKQASHGDENLLQNLIAKISPNRNAAKLVEMFGNPKFLDQQAKDLGLASQIESIPDAYKHFTERNPIGVKKAFNDQYESMLQAMGAPLMQAALPSMRAITDMFTAIGNVANRNSGTIESVIGVVQEIGSLLYNIDSAVAGKIASITGITGMFDLLGKVPWETIHTGLVSFNAGLSGLAATAWQGIITMFDGIRNAISSFIDAIANIIGKAGWLFGFGNNKMPGIEDHSPKRDPLKHPMMFSPGTGWHKPITVSTAFNVDGRQLAQSIIDNIDQLTAHATGAPSPDGIGRYAGGDHNYADV
ncbi:hypothetical protein J4G48_0003480 [Bradyrhizobium barranii subsp. apii]|uniref:hypothetical protein n=1 Tax=Bradyrhizobium barranii TaxID=2992140 RepID=UPI001AA0C8FB|nr:hypothetical protein [Bradyrhizobium barranii]UPT97257.1 hypothetical protein J4G48_0003480 [Bradyrhizobium barranii subsp. apii]